MPAIKIVVVVLLATGAITMTLQPGDSLTGTVGGTPFAYTIPTATATHTATPTPTPTPTTTPTVTRTPTPTRTPTITPTPTPTLLPPPPFAGIVILGDTSSWDALWTAIVDGRWFATTLTDCVSAHAEMTIEFYGQDRRGYPVTTDSALINGAITFTVAVSPTTNIVRTEIRDEIGIQRAVTDRATLLYSAVVSDTWLYAEAVRADGQRVRSAPFRVEE